MHDNRWEGDKEEEKEKEKEDKPKREEKTKPAKKEEKPKSPTTQQVEQRGRRWHISIIVCSPTVN